MYNKNAAYDFGALEEKKSRSGQIISLPGKKARREEKLRARKMFIISVFSVFTMSAAGVSAFVLGQAGLTEYTDKTVKASKELEQCQSVGTQLAVKLKESESAACAGGFKNEESGEHVESIKVLQGDHAIVK